MVDYLKLTDWSYDVSGTLSPCGQEREREREREKLNDFKLSSYKLSLTISLGKRYIVNLIILHYRARTGQKHDMEVAKCMCVCVLVKRWRDEVKADLQAIGVGDEWLSI